MADSNEVGHPTFLHAPGDLLDGATRHIFFTGKGGVGKTSHACALAVALADAGRSVLLVSTDPASNLAQVLGAAVGATPTPMPGVPGLRAVNIDPEAATRDYREDALRPLREILSGDDLKRVEEQLSGACTTEIATFDAFTGLLAEPERAGNVDHVVFDTAPTGHTLRLLQLPAAWTGYLERSPGSASCLGPAAGQEAQRIRFEKALEELRDPTFTTVYLVARPDAGSLSEAGRTAEELASLDITHHRLIVNGTFRASDQSDPLAVGLETEGEVALSALPTPLGALARLETPLKAENLIGLDLLRALHSTREPAGASPHTTASSSFDGDEAFPGLASLVDEMASESAGLVMLMGKGGVGKTSLAAALAVGLADRGHPVHLATTDPAAHLESALPETVDGIRVSRIDPAAETRAYQERVLARRGGELDEEGLKLLQEDLKSPCTEEVAVFHAFSRLVNEGRRGWVILDTAPTGHTLLLLDTAGAYHREVLRNAPGGAGRITTPLMRLQDPSFARILVATLPEGTPVEEARMLQEDLRRAGIEPWAWIVNRSLAATGPTDPLLARRADLELPLIRRVHDELAERVALVPQLPEGPVGAERLRRLLLDPISQHALSQ
jgi:arsenite/tail-anchored protein-transporting ATPase